MRRSGPLSLIPDGLLGGYSSERGRVGLSRRGCAWRSLLLLGWPVPQGGKDTIPGLHLGVFLEEDLLHLGQEALAVDTTSGEVGGAAPAGAVPLRARYIGVWHVP